MKALVLSAGRGERVRPLTDKVPKPLLEIGGHPLIHYPLLMLARAGITEVVVNIHHLGEQIRQSLGDGSKLGLSITYAPEDELLGSGGPLFGLKDYFAGDTFAILNSDTIIDLDFRQLNDFHRLRRGHATLLLRSAGDTGAYSRVEADDNGAIRRMRLLRGRIHGQFKDYPPQIDPSVTAALKPYMYCGVMLCEPSIYEYFPLAKSFSIIEGVLAPMVAREQQVFGFVHRGHFWTVDDLDGYQALRTEFAQSPPHLAYMAHTR